MAKRPKTQSLWERSVEVLRVKTARSRRTPKDGRLDWGFEEGAPREAAGTGAGAAGREGAGQEHEGRLEKADGGRSCAALHGVR